MVAKKAGSCDPADVWMQDYTDDTTETLSLCDLPLNSSCASDSDEHSSSFDDQDDLFEFFSEDFTTTYYNNKPAADTIVFCGKRIPSRGEKAAAATEKKLEIIPRNAKKTHNNFPWKKSKKSGEVKSRWYLFAFGVGRFPPMEMELSDIKNRQSKRRNPAKMFQTNDRNQIIKSSKNGKRAKGLWGLLKALGCKGHQATVF